MEVDDGADDPGQGGQMDPGLDRGIDQPALSPPRPA